MHHHLLLELLSLLDFPRVSVDQEALGHISLGDHGILDHVQNGFLCKEETESVIHRTLK